MLEYFSSEKRHERSKTNRENCIKSLYGIRENEENILITHNNDVIAVFDKTATVGDVLDQLKNFRNMCIKYDDPEILRR